MLRRLAVVLVAATACSSGVATPRATPTRTLVTPSATPTVAPPLEGAPRVYHSAVTALYFAPGHGWLWIAVQRIDQAAGATSVVVHYERSASCHLDNGGASAACPVLWRAEHRLDASHFTTSAADSLSSAHLTDTLRGRRVEATWTGYGDTTRQMHENGNAYLATRYAVGDVRWGADRYRDPKGTDTPSSLGVTVPE